MNNFFILLQQLINTFNPLSSCDYPWLGSAFFSPVVTRSAVRINCTESSMSRSIYPAKTLEENAFSSAESEERRGKFSFGEFSTAFHFVPKHMAWKFVNEVLTHCRSRRAPERLENDTVQR